MIAYRGWMRVLCALIVPLACPVAFGQVQGFQDLTEVWGPRCEGVRPVQLPPRRYQAPAGTNPKARLLYWNETMLEANALDHTPPGPGETRLFGEQIGPHRTSRAFAIVQIAVFDAVNAASGGYRSYTGLAPVTHVCPSVDAAIAQAAHDTLAALYPSQAATFDALLAQDLSRIPWAGKAYGINLGRQAASRILAMRANDGSQHPEPLIGIDWIPSSLPGYWRQDPISLNPLALGAYWYRVVPFVIAYGQFPAAPGPALDSPEYAAAFNEVKRLGGDGIVTPTQRTPMQTVQGIYWAYDGTPGLGTPPRLYNQIAAQISCLMRSDAVETARLLALVNVAMADACCECWRDKFDRQTWRPITGIREADPGTGPTGAGDGNPDTTGDPNWTPLGAPASNLMAPNFTPPFPADPSGHATLGAALFETLRKFYRTDCIRFTFVSDEYNGLTRDNTGNVRPLIPRTFASLSQAEQDNGQSRIYLGIHWRFDKAHGIAQGRAVARYVYANAFTPQ